MKPPGLRFELSGQSLVLGVTSSSHAEDKIWEAVEEAQQESWDVARLLSEVRAAWEYHRREQEKAEDREWERLK